MYISSFRILSTVGGALLLSFAALFFIAFLFIPSVIITALKYRSGVLPSLRSESFKRYRDGLTSLTFLVPVTFWSSIAMFCIVFFLFAVIIFIMIWEVGLMMQLTLSSCFLYSLIISFFLLSQHVRSLLLR